MTDIPWHKNEKMFRRYEPHIQAFLSRWPQATAFDPAPLSHVTFRCRFRDAVASLLEFNWPTCLDVAVLRDIWPKVELRVVNNEVVVGQRSAQSLSPVGSVGHLSTQTPTDKFALTLDNPEPTIVFAIAILLDRKVMTQPVKLKNIPQDLLQQVADRFDVGISQTPDGYIML